MALSVIIPSTGKRVEILIETINAALRALDAGSGEVIVIKNEFKVIPVADPRLRLINVEFNNVSASRNLGAKLAQNELLCFIDDDMLVSADNLQRFEAFAACTPTPYLLTAVWEHSPRVHELKENTFLGHMLGRQLPNDSFKTRYKNVSLANEWQDDAVFKSAMTTTFWEACFSMRRTDYLWVGGMNELFDFGNEGVDFLKRVLSAGIAYYVDPTNVLVHNEWDKFNDWQIPEQRWRTEARLVNEGKAAMASSGRNYLYKLVYGVLIYAFAPLLRAVLRNADGKRRTSGLYFKLFDVYATAIYWHEMKWATLWQQKPV